VSTSEQKKRRTTHCGAQSQDRARVKERQQPAKICCRPGRTGPVGLQKRSAETARGAVWFAEGCGERRRGAKRQVSHDRSYPGAGPARLS